MNGFNAIKSSANKHKFLKAGKHFRPNKFKTLARSFSTWKSTSRVKTDFANKLGPTHTYDIPIVQVDEQPQFDSVQMSFPINKWDILYHITQQWVPDQLQQLKSRSAKIEIANFGTGIVHGKLATGKIVSTSGASSELAVIGKHISETHNIAVDVTNTDANPDIIAAAQVPWSFTPSPKTSFPDGPLIDVFEIINGCNRDFLPHGRLSQIGLYDGTPELSHKSTYEIDAFEILPNALPKDFRLSYVVHELGKDPLPPNSIDIGICKYALPHAMETDLSFVNYRQQKEQFFRSICKSLKPGGEWIMDNGSWTLFSYHFFDSYGSDLHTIFQRSELFQNAPTQTGSPHYYDQFEKWLDVKFSALESVGQHSQEAILNNILLRCKNLAETDNIDAHVILVNDKIAAIRRNH